MTDQTETLADCIARLGLSIRAEFVPFSKSRNAKEKHRSLNWRVTLVQAVRAQGAGGDALDMRYRDIMTTDYQAGTGHCPASKLPVKDAGHANSMMRHELINRECETGKAAHPHRGLPGAAIMPKAPDVIHCLAMDTDVLDYARFEDWADALGYDPDSRKGEAIYRACLEHALTLRAHLGETALSALRAAASEY